MMFSKFLKSRVKKSLFVILVVLFFILAMQNLSMIENFESTTKSINQHLLKGDNSKLVLFYADWCKHCKNIKSDWDSASKLVNRDDNIKMIKINCGDTNNREQKKIMEKYNINGYPTILVLKNGKIVNSYDGNKDKQSFIDFANRFC